MKSLARAPSLRDDEAVIAWFYRVLRNAIVDHYRRGGAEQRALAELAGREAADVDPPIDAELHATICACVAGLVETLKPEYATAIRRVDLDGMPVVEFAREAGITPGNAGVRLHRAHAALRKRLALTCSLCAEHGCLDCRCNASVQRSQ